MPMHIKPSSLYTTYMHWYMCKPEPIYLPYTIYLFKHLKIRFCFELIMITHHQSLVTGKTFHPLQAILSECYVSKVIDFILWFNYLTPSFKDTCFHFPSCFERSKWFSHMLKL